MANASNTLADSRIRAFLPLPFFLNGFFISNVFKTFLIKTLLFSRTEGRNYELLKNNDAQTSCAVCSPTLSHERAGESVTL